MICMNYDQGEPGRLKKKFFGPSPGFLIKKYPGPHLTEKEKCRHCPQQFGFAENKKNFLSSSFSEKRFLGSNNNYDNECVKKIFWPGPGAKSPPVPDHFGRFLASA